jgi:transcriptional regulator
MKKTGPKPSAKIDTMLGEATRITPYGQWWSHDDIADFCGCHRARIQQIEREAFHKIHKRWDAMLKELKA